MKKKIILLIISIFIFSNVNADGIPDCIPCEGKNEVECRINSCLEKRIDQLILVNEKLQDENLSFKIKEEAFNGGLQNYIKTLEESKNIQEEKGKAYNEALNELRNIAYVFGILVLAIVTGIGLYRNGQITEAKEELKGYKNDLKNGVQGYFNEYKELVNHFKEDLKGSLKEEFKKSLEKKLNDELKVEFSEKLQNSLDNGDGIEKFVTEKLLNEIIEGIYENKGKKIVDELNNQLNPKVLEFEEEIKTINKKLEDLGL